MIDPGNLSLCSRQTWEASSYPHGRWIKTGAAGQLLAWVEEERNDWPVLQVLCVGLCLSNLWCFHFGGSGLRGSGMLPTKMRKRADVRGKSRLSLEVARHSEALKALLLKSCIISRENRRWCSLKTWVLVPTLPHISWVIDPNLGTRAAKAEHIRLNQYTKGPAPKMCKFYSLGEKINLLNEKPRKK